MKKNTFILPFMFTMILLAGCISIPTGDGDSIKLTKDGVSIKSKDGEEMTVKGNEDGGSISIEGIDGEGDEINFKSTSSEEIPDDFPDSIPIPEDAVITLGQETQMDGMHAFTVFYEVQDDDVEKYGDMYREYVTNSGYEIGLDHFSDDSIQFSSNKDDGMFNFIIEKKDTIITVQLTYGVISE